ncbi:jg6504 [Pararge aegeria aegeria]|uniref:Jg6504 protein n=1 Tax=Pararge aegeria aegeria TaxID=348720 RepID=A0A8S4SQ50_9NEOP|nr:jg6504 [Pararge aegeria aegeria]
MFTSDYKYKDYIQEIYKTFSPLSWLLKIFSLDSLSRGNKQKFASSYWALAKGALTFTILAAINLFTIYYKFTWFYVELIISVKYADAVQMIYDLCQYFVDLYFVYKYGSDVFYEYIRQYAYIDGMFGMEYYGSIRRRLINVMIFMISMWFSSSLSDYVIWAIGFGLMSTTFFSMAYIYMFIKILTNLHVTVHIMHIESRLRVLGDLIQECYCSSVSCTARIEDAVIKKNWFYTIKTKTSKSQLYPLKKISYVNSNEVKWLSRCYLLLTEQVNFINRMFGMRPVTAPCWTKGLSQGEGLPIITTLGRRDGYRTRYEKMQAAYKDLLSLVQSQPINFHMAHFMRLDYPLLVSICSVFVTYTIILIQSI